MHFCISNIKTVNVNRTSLALPSVICKVENTCDSEAGMCLSEQ